MDPIDNAYAQLIGLGVIWINVHCAGMCGPILAGITATPGRADQSRWSRLRASSGRVLAYQSGRALMYALLGALAGVLGALLETTLTSITHIAGLVMAVGLFGLGLSKLAAVRRLAARAGLKPDGWAARAGQTTGGLARRLGRLGAGPWRMVALGFAMGLLPCMIMFWVLGLAASTASPLHGALVMVTLVAMTTPVLLLAGASSALTCSTSRARVWGERLIPWLVMASAVWLGLVSAAANAWIDHIHLTFDVGTKTFVIMLW